MDVITEFEEFLVEKIAQMIVDGRLPSGLDYSDVTVGFCRNPEHGDITTNLAMILHRELKKCGIV